ncbi:hypothetical protein HK104_010338, partial [Borealophlyctis nickersoniae]
MIRILYEDPRSRGHSGHFRTHIHPEELRRRRRNEEARMRRPGQQSDYAREMRRSRELERVRERQRKLAAIRQRLKEEREIQLCSPRDDVDYGRTVAMLGGEGGGEVPNVDDVVLPDATKDGDLMNVSQEENDGEERGNSEGDGDGPGQVVPTAENESRAESLPQ